MCSNFFVLFIQFSNVAGFIYVTEVDVARYVGIVFLHINFGWFHCFFSFEVYYGYRKCRKRLSYVAPCPGPLPNNLLLAGSLLWVE